MGKQNYSSGEVSFTLNADNRPTFGSSDLDPTLTIKSCLSHEFEVSVENGAGIPTHHCLLEGYDMTLDARLLEQLKTPPVSVLLVVPYANNPSSDEQSGTYVAWGNRNVQRSAVCRDPLTRRESKRIRLCVSCVTTPEP